MSAGPSCPLCGSHAAPLRVGERAGYRLLDCPDCGAGYCEPFRNPGPEYYEHFPDMYPAAVAERADPSSYEYGEALALLRRTLPPGAHVLDVGCGAGGFLHELRGAGFDAFGVDFNSRRAALLKERGFDVSVESLPSFARRNDPAIFDALTIFQVLEHLDDPKDWLAAAKKLLKPGGLFIVGVPNRRRTFDPFQGPGMEDIDFPPHHLTRWDADALARFLSANGFTTLESRPLGVPLPLLQLMMRNTLRFGLATKALKVEQVRHAPESATGAPDAKTGVVKALVSVKECAINLLTLLGYPLFRAAYLLRGWQGVQLFASARLPS